MITASTTVTFSKQTVITFKPTVISSVSYETTETSHSAVIEHFTYSNTEQFEELVKEFGNLPNFITFVCSMVLLICCFIVGGFYLIKHCCFPNTTTPRPIRQMRTRLASISSPVRLLFNDPPTTPLRFINNHNGGSPILIVDNERFYTAREEESPV